VGGNQVNNLDSEGWILDPNLTCPSELNPQSLTLSPKHLLNLGSYTLKFKPKRTPKPQTLNPEPSTLNPSPLTLNPKTLHPKPSFYR